MTQAVKGSRRVLFLLALCVVLAAVPASPALVIRGEETMAGSKAADGAQPGEKAKNGAPAKGPDEKAKNGAPAKGPDEEAESGEPAKGPGEKAKNGAPAKGPDEEAESGEPAKGSVGETDNEQIAKEPEGGQAGENPGGDGAEEHKDKAAASEKAELLASVRLTKNGKAAYITWKRVKGAYAYKVQRSSKEDSGFKNIVSLTEQDNACKDVKIAKGRRYYYRVAAKMEDGSTCFSKAASLDVPLGQVSGVKPIRYSTSSIKVTWEKSRDKHAKCYKVYYATTKNGKYKLAGTTENNWYRVKKLKTYQSYYFRVQACTSKKSSGTDSDLSKTVTMITYPYERLTVFAGDSLTRGLKAYNAVDKIRIGGKKAVVAVDGLNTLTFRTKKVLNGLSAMDEVIRLKPYRVYIMLGGNDIHYLDKKVLIGRYRIILKAIQSGSPKTDIVLLAMSPVTAATRDRLSGFRQIPAYNKDLEALAEEMDLKFYDCTGFMKDSTGWMKREYATADGIHWKAPVYEQYAQLLETYDKSLD